MNSPPAGPNNYDQYAGTVQGILDEIKEKGDEALFAYTEKFDKCKLTKDTIQVTEEEIKAAYEKVDDSLVEVIRKSLVNIREYHEKQKRNSWFDAKPDGTILGQKMTALASVGVYVPGGKAAYPSSVLMNIVPAKVAGVEKIVMVTPPNKDGEVTPATLVAANEAGATHIYKVGGAQAIGALAYGTESIKKVDKIVGPGNIYVALAKKAVYGHVSIDSIAGPSEILVLADDTANPHFVAADLLSQAEHDELASAILVTTSKTLGEKVQEEIEGYLKKLSRAEIIEKSLENFGYILEAETLDEALEVVNAIASEHLEIVTANPFEVMTKVRNAGAIFIGEYIKAAASFEKAPPEPAGVDTPTFKRSYSELHADAMAAGMTSAQADAVAMYATGGANITEDRVKAALLTENRIRYGSILDGDRLNVLTDNMMKYAKSVAEAGPEQYRVYADKFRAINKSRNALGEDPGAGRNFR